MYFSPLLRPSAIVGIISRLRMQFHTTVSQSKVHSAPIGLVMWNQKPPEKATVSEPKAMEWAFNSNVKHELCGQKFSLSVRQPCLLVHLVSVWYFVLHAYLFKVSGFSKVLEIELLSAGLSLNMWRHHFLAHFMTSHIQAALLIQMPIVTMHFHSA